MFNDVVTLWMNSAGIKEDSLYYEFAESADCSNAFGPKQEPFLTVLGIEMDHLTPVINYHTWANWGQVQIHSLALCWRYSSTPIIHTTHDNII